MPYRAEVILDSVNPVGDRLTTFVLTYPRMVHSELMTHRAFSRNSSSSRAIPVEKLIQQVLNEPATPVFWGKNQSGMQAEAELDAGSREHAKYLWLTARFEAVDQARKLLDCGVHKQIVNRLIEPWMWITVICSATDYGNFFHQRCHPAAQPEIRHLAEMMAAAYKASRPTLIPYGEYHLPFITAEDKGVGAVAKRMVSVARCARVSYLNHEGTRDVEKDLALFCRLRDSGHWSPFEHVAMSLDCHDRVANFTGWQQYRKQFPGETVKEWEG